jgi:hypothetical protein
MFEVLGPIREWGGIHEYEPQQEDDNGVDAICKNWDDELSVVQVKYKRDSERLLTANEDHLGNMVKEATLKYRITPHKPNSKETTKYFVITTGNPSTIILMMSFSSIMLNVLVGMIYVVC